jgi:hypothetical protein
VVVAVTVVALTAVAATTVAVKNRKMRLIRN